MKNLSLENLIFLIICFVMTVSVSQKSAAAKGANKRIEIQYGDNYPKTIEFDEFQANVDYYFFYHNNASERYSNSEACALAVFSAVTAERSGFSYEPTTIEKKNAIKGKAEILLDDIFGNSLRDSEVINAEELTYYKISGHDGAGHGLRGGFDAGVYIYYLAKGSHSYTNSNGKLVGTSEVTESANNYLQVGSDGFKAKPLCSINLTEGRRTVFLRVQGSDYEASESRAIPGLGFIEAAAITD